VSSVWGRDAGPYMQALYLAYTVGGIVSPFATRPFMPEEEVVAALAHDEELGVDGSYVVVERKHDSVFIDSAFNSSSYTTHAVNGSSDYTVIYNTTQTLTPEVSDIQEASLIQYAFLTTSILLVLTSVPYLAMCISGRFLTGAPREDLEVVVTVDSQMNEKQALTEQETDNKLFNEGSRWEHTVLHGKKKIFLLMCVAGINFTYNATEDSFGDFIISFCLEYLQWSNTQSVILLSLYWFASCIGGVAGIFLVGFLGATRLLVVSHIAWLLTFILASVGSVYRVDVLLWIAMPASGFFMVQIIPAVFTWTAQNVCPITGKVSSLFLICTGVGIALNPTLIGVLVEKFSYVALMYVLTAEAALSVVLFMIAIFASSRSKSVPPNK